MGLQRALESQPYPAGCEMPRSRSSAAPGLPGSIRGEELSFRGERRPEAGRLSIFSPARVSEVLRARGYRVSPAVDSKTGWDLDSEGAFRDLWKLTRRGQPQR
eukprot:8626872-Pyramimonas_sp.AAC.1